MVVKISVLAELLKKKALATMKSLIFKMPSLQEIMVKLLSARPCSRCRGALKALTINNRQSNWFRLKAVLHPSQ